MGEAHQRQDQVDEKGRRRSPPTHMCRLAGASPQTRQPAVDARAGLAGLHVDVDEQRQKMNVDEHRRIYL